MIGIIINIHTNNIDLIITIDIFLLNLWRSATALEDFILDLLV